MIRKLAAAYFGGALGGLVSTLAVWLVARAGLLAAIDVELAPGLGWASLSHRLLWGGLWGLGHPLAERFARGPVRAGLLLSLAPSAAQLFYFFPARGGELLGLHLGALTPAVVLLANALWGFVLGRAVVAAASGR